MSDDIWMEKGCNCPNNCKDAMTTNEECVYFIARTRGPVSFKQCANSAEGVNAYHDSKGVCLHCEFTIKQSPLEKVADPVGFGRVKSHLTDPAT